MYLYSTIIKAKNTVAYLLSLVANCRSGK